MTIRLTEKQLEAQKLLGSQARNIMLRGGSRSGKTFLLTKSIIQRALNAPGSRHAAFRFRFNHIKTSLWKDTMPKVMRECFPRVPHRFDKTDFFLELPGGSEFWIGGLDDKERVEKILGAEYATLYFNESSQIPWGSIETAMSRLAQKVELAPEIAKATGRTHLALKAYFDCNPPSKLHWSYQLFRAKLKPGTREAVANPDDYVEMQINPDDNRENLPAEYFDVLAGMSAVKRLRFEDGEWASEVNGALWSLEDRKIEGGRDIPGIDRFRVSADQLPELVRIVVSVDPSGTKGDGSGDDIGIVVVGLGVDGRGYVLEDGTCQLSPEGWGRRAVDLYHRHEADSIIGERNFGGDMVRFTIQTADATVPFKEVVASRGKVVRAEPVSALYEQGKVSHVGVLADLEDQMCLAAGTLIETECGQIPIEKVNAHHRVLTRNGFAPLKWAGYTGTSSKFVEIEAGSCKIRATESHPIFDTDTGKFVSAAHVRPTQRLLVSHKWANMDGRSRGVETGIIECRPGTTATPEAGCSTAQFTKRILARSALEWISTISTAIRATIDLKISKPYLALSTLWSTLQSAMLGMRPTPPLAHAGYVERQPSLSAQSRAATAHIDATCVSIAPQSLPSRLYRSLADVAARQGNRREGEISAHGAARTITTLRHTEGEGEPVYNLSVADGYLPEFFANGILVHNCNFTASGYVGDGSPDRADALVWALTELMLGARPVFSITPSDLSCAPFPIPTSWPRGFAMKVEPDRTCALWAAYDRDGDILYVTTEHSRRYADARANAQAIVARGDWIPGLATVDASNQMDAQQLLAIYHSLKLKVMLDDASGESGIATMTDRISTGRLKVFETCTEFFKEYRGYRRDEDDRIIGGGLMHCAQSLARPNAIKRMVAKAPEKILAQRVTHVGDPVAGY